MTEKDVVIETTKTEEEMIQEYVGEKKKEMYKKIAIVGGISLVGIGLLYLATKSTTDPEDLIEADFIELGDD